MIGFVLTVCHGQVQHYNEFFLTVFRFRNNARRDKLDEFWSRLFGTSHGLMMVSSFYENVPRHLYEKRDLAPGERLTGSMTLSARALAAKS